MVKVQHNRATQIEYFKLVFLIILNVLIRTVFAETVTINVLIGEPWQILVANVLELGFHSMTSHQTFVCCYELF